MDEAAVTQLETYTFEEQKVPGVELNTHRPRTPKHYLTLARRDRSSRALMTLSVSNVGGETHEDDLLSDLRGELCRKFGCSDGELEQRLSTRSARLGPIVVMLPKPRPSAAFFDALKKIPGFERVRFLVYTEAGVGPGDTHLELICPPIDPKIEQDAEAREQEALAEITEVLQS